MNQFDKKIRRENWGGFSPEKGAARRFKTQKPRARVRINLRPFYKPNLNRNTIKVNFYHYFRVFVKHIKS